MSGNPLLDPRLFVVDPNVKPFEADIDVDLLAPNAPTVATGKFVCFDYLVPQGQCLIVHGVAVYARQRINVGSVDALGESVQMIEPKDGNGFFAFEPQVNSSAPYIVITDQAALRAAAGSLNNKNRVRARGWTELSINPRVDAHLMWTNPLYSFLVPSEASFKVIFSILPAASANALPASGQYAIGVGAVKRVDYAGAFVVGEQMSSQHYSSIVDRLRKQVGE